ncbi:MAG: DUF11 domain-containing protein [Nitrosomonadales bacterium]|nr:DUF11 domain-containing protein [Nitrosomonadales bacterium]
MSKWSAGFKPAFVLFLAILLSSPLARADYVGELETTKYFDPDTIALIQSRLPGGLLAGDEISYYIQFTPTNNGGMVGGGGFVTDYIPAGTQVVNAQFVRLNSDGSYTQIAPPGPAAVLPAYVPLYSDTGIFYSTNPKTAVYSNPVSPTITPANGYATIGGGCGGISLPSTTHNAWDSAMVTKFQGAARNTTGTCAAPPAINYNVLGLSPVAGPDSFLTLDSTGVVGPWQRIAYPGSYKGTAKGVASYGSTNACIGGTPTSAGYNLSPSNPLPINTTAVRFAAGKVTVGELFSVRITLKLTSNMPVAGLINNTEVFGGDASLDPGSTAGKDNHWKYHCPAVAVANSNLLLVKQLVGACTGVGCVPAPITAGVVPSAINLKLRYTIQYLNLSGSAQTNVVLKDTFAIGASYVAGSAVQLSGAPIGAPTPSAAPVVLTFPTIASLASGTGGKVQYDVVFVSAPSNNVALINTANMVSTQVPAPGVSSKAIATASTKANLWISKSTGTPSVTSGSAVTYTISIPNNGAASATSVVVKDYLPSAGGTTVNDRFSYLSLASATITTSAGVVSNVVPTVASGAVAAAAPYTGLNREQVTFTLPAATAIPAGGKLTITFNATVGSNVPASTTPYLNDANVGYVGGATATSLSETIGTAPVTVTAPMSLTAKVDCVYAGAVCVPYTSGTIAPLSKIKYKLSYSNISAAALSTLVLTNTLPANTSYVAGTTIRDGAAIANPGIAGQVLTFATLATLNSGATGYVSFDVQLGAGVTNGTDIINTAKITASTFPAGVTVSVTTSVRDQANLQITKTASPSTIQIGGSVTYTITVTNTGNAPASGIKIYDELPFVGATADPLLRFNFVANSDAFNLTNTSGNSTLNFTGHTLATTVPPTFSGYTGQTNRQEVLWTFVAVKELASGDSFTLTYTATAGANIPASATPYNSDVQAQYISATNTMYSSAASTAPVTIGGLDHIRILHNGTGLTCMPETLTVQACGDAACGTLYTGSVTTTVNGVGATTFSGGTTTVSLPVTTAGSFTLGATLTSPAPQTAARCFNGVTETCTLNFSDAGLIISTVADGTETVIPNQVAGVLSGNYVLRAVKKNTATSACTAALTGAQTVNLGYECNDPTSCAAGNLLKVNGFAVQSNGNNPFLGYSYTGVSLTFDANGNTTTPISFSYEDVGQVTLRMQKTVNGADLLGTSNAFIVTPHHFAVDVCGAATAGDCAAGTAATLTDGTGAVLAVAGTASTQTGAAFKATVRSMSANNNITPSFGTAGSANGGTSPITETVNITHTCVAPIIAPATACAANGTLSGTQSTTRSGFASGVSTVSDLTWSEVGVITLTATNSSFMGAGSSTGTSANAGRFTPDHFDTLVAGQMPCTADAGCAAPVTQMVYSGQVFNSVSVMPRNANNAQTGNYQGAFAKVVNLSAVDVAGGTGTPAGGSVIGTNTVAATAFNAGSGTLTGNLAANTGAPVFTFNTSPTVPTDVYVRAMDSDGVTSKRPANSIEGGVKVVSGRFIVGNVHGSELLPLQMTATVQYWNGASWVKSATDSVTPINTNLSTAGGSIVAANFSAPLASVSVAAPGAGTVAAGLRTFTLNKPNIPGSVDISLSGPAYLLAGSNGAGVNPSRTGHATFGVYKGANEFIYLRENY